MDSVIIDTLKKERLLQSLNEGKRIDGRKFEEVRPLTIETGIIPKADGSAKVSVGDSQVISGVKIQPDKPFPDLGDKGILICTAEVLPLADPTAETGPPNEDVIELARVVDRGIRETEMIDLSQLVLEQDKTVIGMFADSSILNVDGNLFDPCSYAAVAAILSCQIPKYEIKEESPVLVEGEKNKPPINTIPVSVTMARIGDHIVVDPNADEWNCMDARVTITTNSDGNICALQKGGNDGFTYDQLVKCSQLAIDVGKSIRGKLEKVI